MSPKSYLTESGIPGVGVVPFGIHLCHFYPSREELLSALIPYFSAGVRNNELCIWVAAQPLPARDIVTKLTESNLVQAALASGQLRVMDACDWYGDPAALNPEGVTRQWLAEEDRAIAMGYEGLRITGNTSFVGPASWGALMTYEKCLHDSLQNRRIITCCSYSRRNCNPVDVLEVLQRHDAALDCTEGHWQVFMRGAQPQREAGF